MHTLVKIISGVLMICALSLPFSFTAFGATTIDGQSLVPTARLFIKPYSHTVALGSTFEVPIYIDTNGNNINAINVRLAFDPAKLSIVKPSEGKSLFGIWIENPKYDNAKGTASLVGVIPEGIVTSAGLVTTVVFKPLVLGPTNVEITDYSGANLGDGYGTEVRLTETGASYTVVPGKPIVSEVGGEEAPLTVPPDSTLARTGCQGIFISFDSLREYGLYALLLLLLLLLLEDRRKRDKTSA